MRLIISFLSVIVVVSMLSACSSKKSKSIENLAQHQAEELYNRARRSLDRGNYSFAISYYRALEANYPYGDFTEQGKLDMIFALDKSGQVEEAVEAADNFISLYPTHPNVDYAYFMKGVASFEQKQSRFERFIKGSRPALRDPKPYKDSEAAFNELVKRYPKSKYAGDARQRVTYIRNALAERELSIANFYFDNETYVAALNRCKHIVYHYETTPVVEDALVLMQATYEEMGLNDLAVSTQQVLKTNFPDREESQEKKKRKSLLSRINPFD